MDIEDLAQLAAEYDLGHIRAPASLQEVVSSGNCVGCGICESICGSDYIQMKVLPPKQRMRPVFHKALEPEAHAKALAACPGAKVGGSPGWTPKNGMEAFVGQAKSIQKGYASDPETRDKAAAAGGLTSLAMFLLDSKQVEFVVHVKASAMYSDEKTQGTKMSFSSAEVFEGRGSRYGPVAPLQSLEEALRRSQPFAVVAKPCDINAVRNMAKVDPRVDQFCKALMTISCGSYPDNVWIDKWLQKNDIAAETVEEFRWRGSGCPGDCPYVRSSDGREAKMDYVDFWFNNPVATLQYQWRCKMCTDFLGYQADVTVMDCWPGGIPEKRDAKTEERKHEWDGWVLVVARTERGQEIVDSAKAAGVLTLGPADGHDILRTQPHQARRAAPQLIRRLTHAADAEASPSKAHPLLALDADSAVRVATWALDEDFVDAVMKTGPPAPMVPDAAEQLREILPKGEKWAEALLKMPERHIAYHLDNFKGTKKRLDRGDALETVAMAAERADL